MLLHLFSRTSSGLHVVLTMFTGYLLGFAAFRALFNQNPAMVLFEFYISLLFFKHFIYEFLSLLTPFPFPPSLTFTFRMQPEEFLG